MFLFGGIMLVVAIIFAIMSYMYTYSDFSGNVEPATPEDAEDELKKPEFNRSDSSTHL